MHIEDTDFMTLVGSAHGLKFVAGALLTSKELSELDRKVAQTIFNSLDEMTQLLVHVHATAPGGEG